MCNGQEENAVDVHNRGMLGFYKVAPPLFSTPLGRSRMTILLLFLGPLGPGFLVRVPLVPQPHIDTGCLSDLDLPRPPP